MTFYTLLRLTLLTAGASAICPIGSIRGPARLSCYKLHAKPMAWLDAKAQCRKDNGHLASIPSPLTNSFVSTTASSSGCGASYWAGGEEAAGQWSWIDNSHWSFTKWAKGQPTVGPNCLALNAADGTWSSPECSKTLPFLCSVPDSEAKFGGATPPPNVPTPVPPKQCPTGWTFFPETDLCYGVLSVPALTSSFTAADLCARNDAVLPSITDFNLNFRLMSFVLDADTGSHLVHIGLRYNSTAKQWYWMDGRAESFTNWKTSYPQSVDAAQCARMSLMSPQTGSWINTNCADMEKNAVLCERETGEYE